MFAFKSSPVLRFCFQIRFESNVKFWVHEFMSPRANKSSPCFVPHQHTGRANESQRYYGSNWSVERPITFVFSTHVTIWVRVIDKTSATLKTTLNSFWELQRPLVIVFRSFSTCSLIKLWQDIKNNKVRTCILSGEYIGLVLSISKQTCQYLYGSKLYI